MIRYFTRESRIDRAYNRDRSRFGMTDAERNERLRSAHARWAMVQFVLALCAALVLLSHLEAL